MAVRCVARNRGFGWSAVATAGALALAGAACGDDDLGDATAASGQPSVVVTTSIWADVVANLVCDGGVRVETIIPPGGDPHGFEPSLADRGRLDRAALVVANGLLLEEGLDDTLDAVADAGTPVFRIGEHIDTLEYGLDDHDDEDDGDHDDEDDGDHDDEEHLHGGHEGDDPHVWFDPSRVAAVLPELGEQLAAHTGLNAATIDDCIGAYRDELVAVDTEIAEMVATVPEERRTLVTSHESLGYFADRYGFEVIGTVLPLASGLAQTNPAQLEELARLIEDNGVPAIFAETPHADDDVRALQDRVGDIDVVPLNAGTLGEPGSSADSYVGLLRTNAVLIVDALG